MKKTLLVVAIITLILAAAGAAAYLILKITVENRARHLFENKVVKITGRVEAVGLVHEYREKVHIILIPLEGKNRNPELYPIDNTYVMTILASSEAEYMEQKQQELQRIKEEGTIRPSPQEEADLHQNKEFKESELTALSEVEKKVPRKEALQMMLNKGVRLLLTEKYQEAIENFSKANNLDPGNSTGFFYMGLAQLVCKDTKSSLSAFTRAIINKHDLYDAFFFRGLTKIADHQADSAIDDLAKAVNNTPLFSHIPKRYLEEEVIRIPGGEIHVSSKQPLKKSSGKMTIKGKELEYQPVEGDGFQSAQQKEKFYIRQRMTNLVYSVNEQAIWEIIHNVIDSYIQSLRNKIDSQKNIADKEKQKNVNSN